MKTIEDILRTILGQNEDIFSTNQVNDNENQQDDSINQLNDEYDGNDIACERAIIKCRMKHGRLRMTTTKFCEKKFGKSTTKRTKSRLDMRERRGRDNRKEMISDMKEVFKPIWDSFFEQKEKDQFKSSL